MLTSNSIDPLCTDQNINRNKLEQTKGSKDRYWEIAHKWATSTALTLPTQVSSPFQILSCLRGKLWLMESWKKLLKVYMFRLMVCLNQFSYISWNQCLSHLLLHYDHSINGIKQGFSYNFLLQLLLHFLLHLILVLPGSILHWYLM